MCKKRANLARHPEKAAAEAIRRRARAKGISVEEYLVRDRSLKPDSECSPKYTKQRNRLRIDGLIVRKNQKRICPLLSANPKLYYLANAERLTAESRRYYHSNRNKAIKKVQRWKSANPGKLSQQRYRRRVCIETQLNDLTTEQWNAIKLAYKFRCAYCGDRKQRLTMDHVIPVSKGGAHTAANIVPACQSCNSSKNARLPLVEYQPHLII
jgi:5-methylcytosine-specific restriction endonuclease McrA